MWAPPPGAVRAGRKRLLQAESSSCPDPWPLQHNLRVDGAGSSRIKVTEGTAVSLGPLGGLMPLLSAYYVPSLVFVTLYALFYLILILSLREHNHPILQVRRLMGLASHRRW